MTSLSEAETKVTKTGKVHKGDYGTSYDGDDEKKPAASTEKRGRGRPKKGADDSGEVKSYDTKSLGSVFGGGQKPKKDIGTVSKKHSLKEYIEEAEQIQIKPAQQNTQVIQQGNKTLGTVTNPQLANQIKQSIGKGEMTLNPEEEMNEDELDEFIDVDTLNQLASHPMAGTLAAAGGAALGGAIGGAVKKAGDWYANRKEQQAQRNQQTRMAEGKKPDFLDVDKDSDKKESFKKAVKDKEDKKKVKESRDHSTSEYTYEKVAKVLAREKPGMDTNKSSDDFYSAVYHELVALGMTPKSANSLMNYDEDFMSDVASAYAHYEANPGLDEDTARDFRIDGVKPTNDFTRTGTSMAAPKGTPTTANRPVPNPTPFGTDPIAATTDRAINFISGLRKPSNPFKESTTMKDMQVESWASQLNSLLNEGITVSSSQGQQGQPDSVSVTANDADAQALLAVLHQAGIGGFGAGEEQPQADAYGVISQGEEEPTGTGTEPEMSPNVVGDGDDMLSLIKKMSGISDAPAQGSEGGQDYEDEEGEEAGTLEPTSSDEEGSDSEFAGDEGSDEEGEEEGQGEGEEVTDEGNAFGQEVRQKKSDNIPDSQQRIKTGGQNLPVKEGEHECNECGMMESSCECDHDQVNEYANDAGGDAMGDTQLAQLKALLSVGNDLHKMKTSQAMGNPVRVTESKEMINEWKKLSGI
jgi:hypothetical protein